MCMFNGPGISIVQPRVHFFNLVISEGVTRMRIETGVVLIACLWIVPSQSAAQEGPQGPLGEKSGVGTIYGTVVQALGENRLHNMPVYIFTLAQSRRLREMDESAYKRAHATGIGEDEAGAIDSRNEDALADLAPKLPRTAFGKSDNRGIFVFRNLPCGERYYLVALHIHESGVFLAAKISPVLKDGEKLKVDLRDDVPWNERFKAD